MAAAMRNDLIIRLVGRILSRVGVNLGFQARLKFRRETTYRPIGENPNALGPAGQTEWRSKPWRRLFLFVSETREAVREDQECRSPEANKNTEKLAVCAGFKCGRFSSCIIPDGDGG